MWGVSRFPARNVEGFFSTWKKETADHAIECRISNGRPKGDLEPVDLIVREMDSGWWAGRGHYLFVDHHQETARFYTGRGQAVTVFQSIPLEKILFLERFSCVEYTTDTWWSMTISSFGFPAS